MKITPAEVLVALPHMSHKEKKAVKVLLRKEEEQEAWTTYARYPMKRLEEMREECHLGHRAVRLSWRSTSCQAGDPEEEGEDPQSVEDTEA